MFSNSVVIPLVTALGKEYPDASLFLMNFIISGSEICALAAGLLTGILIKYVRKKHLLIWGTVTFFIAGVSGAFSPNLEFLAFTRALDAISDGILTVTTASLIVDLWKEEQEQGFVFGLYNMLSGFFGSIASVIAGYAAVVSWRNAFYVNAISIIAVILCILFVPDIDTKGDSRSKVENENNAGINEEVNWYPGRFVFAMITLGFLQTFCYTIEMLLDVYIAEQEIGNSIVTGYMGFISGGFGAVGNLTAAFLMVKFRRKKLFVAMCAAWFAITFFMYANCHSVPLLVLCLAMTLIAQFWIIIYFNVYTANSVPAKYRGFCIAIVTNMVYIDAFICTYIPTIASKLFGTKTIAETCFVIGIRDVVIMVIYVILSFVRKQKPYSYI